MLLILSLLLLPFLVFCLRAAMGQSDKFTKTIKVSRIVFVSLIVLFSTLLTIENINYYLVGYRSTSIVYLFTAISGLVYTLSDRRFILTSIKRIILNSIAAVFMMGVVFLVVEMLEDFNKQMIYSDSRFRLESTGKGPLSPCGLPKLFVKNGLFERKSDIITPDTCISEADISGVNIQDVDTGYLVSFFLADKLRGDSTIQLTIRYSKP